MYKLLLAKLAAFLLLVLSAQVFAGGVVIVNSENPVSLSQSEVQNIYLAKSKAFPNGREATPVNLPEGNSTRSDFERAVCEKSESQMKSYWAKLLFTGKAVPVKQLNNDQEVLSFVSGNANAVGYIDAASVNDSVRVVLEF